MSQTNLITPAMPDPRARSDRRQRDGLGLLPRATNRWERQRRQALNQQIGVFLLALGLSIWSGSLIVLVWEHDAVYLVGAVLGLYIALRGFEMVMWRDRRVRDRRTADRPPDLATPAAPASLQLPPRFRPLWRRRQQATQAGQKFEVHVIPPMVD